MRTCSPICVANPPSKGSLLTGLDEQGVTEFLERTAGHALDDPGRTLAVAVHAETEGNPFFIGEVLLHLVESGAIVFHGGRYSVARRSTTSASPKGCAR